MAHIDSSTGWAYGDFLLGYVNNWYASVTPEYGARLKSPEFFVQDDFKVTPNLTLNMGVRYQMNRGWSEVHGNIDAFDPTVANTDGTLGAMWYSSTHANGRKNLQANTNNTWLPRVGASWLVNSKTTLRGGFGIYAYNMSLDGYGGGMGAPFGSSGGAQDNTAGITPIVKLDGNGNEITPLTGVTSTNPLPYTSALTTPDRFNGQGVSGAPYHTPVAQIYQWNTAIQRELGSGLAAEMSYVASHGKNLSFPMDLDEIPQSEILTTGVNKAAIPYKNFTGIGWNTYNAISNYHSLQAQITKRMQRGVSFNFNYVWSHFLDDQDSSGWGSRGGQQNFQNGYDPRANYGNSAFDVRNAFKGNVFYELPFGKVEDVAQPGTGARCDRRRMATCGNRGSFVRCSFPTGDCGEHVTNAYRGGCVPDWSGISAKPAHRDWHTWYNHPAFNRPSDGTFGDSGRNPLHGPGINQFNMSAHKQFELFEAWAHTFTMQFRIDTTNTFNHASFGAPNGTLTGAGGAGNNYTAPIGNQISGTSVGGRTVQLALRLSF